MEHFIDLHIHSRYSRATSKELTTVNLDYWGAIKGLSLIGTGDMTHPGWLDELDENLELRDDGFYSLKGRPNGLRFVPSGEVSAIYKQDGKTRKIHLVVLAPSLCEARKFSNILGSLGNVTSDGRPILGLSAKQILEIALTVSSDMVVIPAHIWTPWFSLFGAKSGFDNLEECFGDLSGHITALETGLSSDPAMNRLVSALDPYVLVSSSDAHSPDKLAREASILKGDLTWNNLLSALRGGSSLSGTIEFFPEEGKYHLDGHLNCGVVLDPKETKANRGLCPVCGKELTIGVLHRVTELADRENPVNIPPDYHLVPLAEILSQIFKVGPKSKKVAESYQKIINEFDSELNVLLNISLNDINQSAGPLLSLAIGKMRRGEVEAIGGYDGQFGTIKLISDEEQRELSGQGSLFDLKKEKKIFIPDKLAKIDLAVNKKADEIECNQTLVYEPLHLSQGDLLLDNLDSEQAAAVTDTSAALSILAGPGSGKTRVLVHRAAWLLRENLVRPEEMLLSTFTRKAADSLAPRLRAALPFRTESKRVSISTLHGMAYKILKKSNPDWNLATELFLEDLIKKSAKKCSIKAKSFSLFAAMAKNQAATLSGEADLPDGAPEGFLSAFRYYNNVLLKNKLWDFDDLINQADPNSHFNFKAILIDEFQDLSAAQFSFIKRLMPPYSHKGYLTVIGDKDQSIYAFRGACPEIFDWLEQYPNLKKLELSSNYRSTKTIVTASEAVAASFIGTRTRRKTVKSDNGAKIIRAVLPNPQREAAYVVSRIMAHLGVLNLGIGGTSAQDQDFIPGLALNDIAVIFRLRSLGEKVAQNLDEKGLAWQMCGEDPLTAVDGLDFSAEKINLLTMHASKGLEFKLVFIIGLEEGLCPYFVSEDEEKWRADEEKRLFYVALTRAQEHLYLCRSNSRRLYGEVLSGRPSPYWGLIPDSLCLDVSPKIKMPKTKKSPGLFDGH